MFDAQPVAGASVNPPTDSDSMIKAAAIHLMCFVAIGLSVARYVILSPFLLS
jgi:hypothetical protein